MIDQNILDLIALCKEEGKKSVIVNHRVSKETYDGLREMGIGVYWFGKNTVINWSRSIGKTSGKIFMPLLLEFISDLARKSTRNIFT